MSKLWPYLEVAAGCMAPAVTWQEWLGSDWEVVRKALMGRRPGRAASLPCPRGGEPHAVITHDEDDIVAVPDDESCTCADHVVTADDVERWQVSPKKLGLALAKALELQPRDGDTGIAGVREIGAFSGQAVPVFLILARDGEAFRAAVSELVARQRKAFGLLVPTNRHYGARCRELMEGCGAVFVDLETNIEITKAGALQAKTAPGELLKGLLAKDGEAMAEDTARGVFAIIQKMESDKVTKPPSVVAVFRMVCIEGVSTDKAGPKLGCSKGTVMNRVEAIKAATGMTLAQLRRMSGHFERMEEQLTDSRAKNIYRRGQTGLLEDDEDGEY